MKVLQTCGQSTQCLAWHRKAADISAYSTSERKKCHKWFAAAVVVPCTSVGRHHKLGDISLVITLVLSSCAAVTCDSLADGADDVLVT